MNISPELSDTQIMKELGQRIAQVRIRKGLSQRVAAKRSGIGLQTLQRLEHGEVATGLSSFIKVCKTLELVRNLNAIAPEPEASPMSFLTRALERPMRVSRALKSRADSTAHHPFEWKD
jgi:transcriptional regulator with XRE-family HTH domain